MDSPSDIALKKPLKDHYSQNADDSTIRPRLIDTLRVR